MDVIGTSHDNVAALVQGLDEMRWRADEYVRDRSQQYAVWLHAQLSGETGERRAMARQVGVEWLSEHYSGEMVGFRPGLRVAVEREPYWERTSATTEVETGSLSTLGGVYDYTASPAADVVGDVPARLNRLYAWESGSNLSVLWAGFRSVNKHGSLASFDPCWGVSEGTEDTDTSSVADATAQGGTRVEVTFATEAGWARRGYDVMQIGDSSRPGEKGPFLMLLRAKVDAGTEADVKLVRFHVGVDDDGVWTEPKRITATGWTIHPLGLWENEGGPMLEYWARRVSGAGSLHLDCIVFIPTDEYFLFAEGTSILGHTNISNSLQFYTRADNSIVGYAAGLGGVDVYDVEAEGVGVPVGDGRLVVCAARADRASTLGDSLTLKMGHYPRWCNLRGAE